MLYTIQGIYRDGKIELVEQPADIQEDTIVLVTFLETNLVNLQERGIDKAAAGEMRARMATFAEEWDSPEMSIYDNYDAAKTKA